MAFQGYYNRLYLAMYEEEMDYQKMWYECLKLADSCQLWLYLYGMPVQENAMQIASRIYAGETETYLKNLRTVLDNYGIDEDFRNRITELICEIDQHSKIFVAAEENIREKEPAEKTYTIQDNQELNSLYYDLLHGSKEPFRFVLSETDINNTSYEEAVFAPENVLRASYEFLNSTSDVRKLSLRMSEMDTLLFTVKGNSAAICMLIDKEKEAFEKKCGVNRAFLDRMADFLSQLMKWIMEVEIFEEN